MNNNFREIIALLADGKSRSGQEIGDLLNITRSAVWKIMHKLAELGIPVERNQGKGYRFTRPVQLLNKKQIWQNLSPQTQQQIPHFELVDTLGSTNDTILRMIKDKKPSGTLLLTEHQTQGRARFGRQWHSPYAANIYLALYWRFIKDTSELSGLTQAVACAVINALSKYGISELALKWPNDLYHSNKKLCSVLVDLTGESHSCTDAVIGVGLNVSMCSQYNTIDQPWTDLNTITGQFTDRNELSRSLITDLYATLAQFDKEGFAPFVDQWASNDYLLNKPLAAFNTQEKISGTGMGLGSRGELLIETASGIVPFSNGSVRLQTP